MLKLTTMTNMIKRWWQVRWPVYYAHCYWSRGSGVPGYVYSCKKLNVKCKRYNMKCEMKKIRFKIISYQIPHQLIKMDFVKRDCVRILDPLSFSTIEWKHWDKTESIDLIPHSDQRSHFICWYLWVKCEKSLFIYIFELHTFGMTDDIWDNSRGKPPIYLAPPLLRLQISNLR